MEMDFDLDMDLDDEEEEAPFFVATLGGIFDIE